MRIRFYAVSIERSTNSLEDVVKKILEKNQIDRELLLGGHPVFLEDASFASDGMIEMEFTKRRLRHGPGLSQPGKPTKDIPVGELGGFGEGTAAVWSPTGHMGVQCNQDGVSVLSIRLYLESFLLPRPGSFANINFDPILNDKASALLEASRIQRRLEVRVDYSKITQEMADANLSLQAMAQLGMSTDSHVMNVSLVAKRGKHGTLKNVKQLVKILMRDESTQKLEVKVKEDADARLRTLDLLEMCHVVDVDDDSIGMTAGKRWKFDDRARMIREGLMDWLRAQQLI